MDLKLKECEDLEKQLTERGYKKYTVALTSSEDYAYFKSFKEGEETLYQISYRFWDWRKYPGQEDRIGVDIVIIVSNRGRTDMIISYPELNFDEVEGIAKEFYELCKRHNLD